MPLQSTFIRRTVWKEEYKFNHMTDDEIVALPEVAPLFDVKRHNTPMTFAQIKTLVKALQPGMARAANLERYGHVWRLRFALRLDGSKRVRRSILIADAETLMWVREYFDWARSKRQEYKSEAAAIRFKKFWEAGGREFAESIAARLEAYDHIA